MKGSNNRIPKKGVNPAVLKLSLAEKNKAMDKLFPAVQQLSGMVNNNSNILGQLVVMFEVLKDKKIITNDEIKAKFKQLKEDREKADAKKESEARDELAKERHRIAHPDEDSENPEGSTVQPKDTESDENSGGSE